MKKTILDSTIPCTIYEQGEKGPLILWTTSSGIGEGEEHLADSVAELIGDAPVRLAIWQVEDWNRDLSPWQAPVAFGDGQFQGKAPEVLKRLGEELLPVLQNSYSDSPATYIAGYSLAGLFALWAAYETDWFDGAISGSGSLWFPGWDIYMEGRGLNRPSAIYISLGGKEEKTNNRMMAIIGERTRTQEKLLKADPMCRRVKYEQNSGGHFADSGKRMAKGIAWILGCRN